MDSSQWRYFVSHVGGIPSEKNFLFWYIAVPPKTTNTCLHGRMIDACYKCLVCLNWPLSQKNNHNKTWHIILFLSQDYILPQRDVGECWAHQGEGVGGHHCVFTWGHLSQRSRNWASRTKRQRWSAHRPSCWKWTGLRGRGMSRFLSEKECYNWLPQWNRWPMLWEDHPFEKANALRGGSPNNFYLTINHGVLLFQ